MSDNFPNNLNSANSFPCGSYGPFGFNDNNFNRRQFPSNMYPPNGGTDGNPFGNFNPTSTTSRMNTEFTDFNKAFNENEPIIERINYKNQNNLIHNNVGDSILDENIVEYRVYIDSLDRDISVYPNPFDFTVRFCAAAKGMIKDVHYSGAPGPVINKDFRNIKYIKLESIVLPQFLKYIKANNGEYIRDPNSYLPNERFLILSINELEESNRVYTTVTSGKLAENSRTLYSSHIPKPFGIIFPDAKYGDAYYRGTTYTSQGIYNNSTLGNIKKLTLKLYDSRGKLLSFDHLLSLEQINNNKRITEEHICHPLNKNIQVHYTFVIAVIEPHINNLTKYEN